LSTTTRQHPAAQPRISQLDLFDKKLRSVPTKNGLSVLAVRYSNHNSSDLWQSIDNSGGDKNAKFTSATCFSSNNQPGFLRSVFLASLLSSELRYDSDGQERYQSDILPNQWLSRHTLLLVFNIDAIDSEPGSIRMHRKTIPI
jgi:hypothetical protein